MSTPMQGQRSRSSSLAGAFDFDNVSSSSNTSVDQPIYWNDVRNPVDNRGVDFCPAPSNNIPFLNSIRQERQYLPGSSNIHAEVDDDAQKTEHLSSASANGFAVSGIVPQDRVFGPANFVPLSNQGPSPSSFAPNLNSPVGFMGRGSEDSPLIECPNLYMPSRPDALAVASSSREVGQDNGTCPGVQFNGRLVPCKRKSLEGHVGTSSEVGDSSYMQNVECSSLTDTHAAFNTGMNSAFSPASDQRDIGHGLSLAGVTASDVPDQTPSNGSNYSQRNYRIQMNSVDQGTLNPIVNSIIQSTGTSSQQQSAVPAVDPSLETRSVFPGGNGSIRGHHAVLHIPAMSQGGPSVRWSRSIISRRGGSPNAAFSRTREVASNDEASSSRGRRNARENPLFVSPSEMGIFIPNPLSSRIPVGDTTLPSNGASSSQSGPSSGVHHSSNVHWDPHHNRFSHYPHRWSENVCRSLMSSMDSEPEGQANHSSLNPGYPVAGPQEMVLPSRPSFPSHAFPSRSSILSLAAAAEGRRRLASEVRNVLDLVRRGEGLRFEDFMLLEQSVFFGMADIHDRHRDMRLDVDNMSYEELLALEERIGNVSTGLSEETILARLKQRQHAAADGSSEDIEPCCVCQEEYIAGDDLGALECGHDFHRDCIKQWLMLKNLCPVCKTTGLTT
ncbi:hypothetical protein MLD38_022317 [Melastoma candidum]|uniref:Uncharacterized protein n=1 Tax=Melastoma candidum TaxID=119954 RepID=A0ACB9QJW1_9MYRT|nr:hypothetical protein MLD38_022317 [Melastoma candidum]